MHGNFHGQISSRRNAIVLIAMIGVGLDVAAARITYGLTLPAFSKELQFNYSTAGLLGSLHLIGFLVGTLLSPSLSRNFGPAALCRGSQVVFGLGMLASGIASGAPLMAFGRTLSGVSAGTGLFSLITLVFSVTAQEKRATAVSFAYSGSGIGIVLSGVFATALAGVGWRWGFLVPAALSMSIAFFVPSVAAPEPRPSVAAELQTPSQHKGWRNWLLLMFSYLVFGTAYIAFSTFATVRLKEIGAGLESIAIFWVVFGSASLFGSAAGAAMLSRAFGSRIALFAALLSGAAGAIIATSSSAAGVLPAAALVGFGLMATPSIVNVHIRRGTTELQYPYVYTTAMAALGVGQLLGPAIAGVITDRFGAVGVALLSACLYSLGSATALLDGVLIRREE